MVARAMRETDVVIAASAHSLTHTQARKAACSAGALIVTMPGITEDIFFQAPLQQIMIRLLFIPKNSKSFLIRQKEQ